MNIESKFICAQKFEKATIDYNSFFSAHLEYELAALVRCWRICAAARRVAQRRRRCCCY